MATEGGTRQPTVDADISHLEFDIEACEIEECGDGSTHIVTPECGHAFLVCTEHANRLTRLLLDHELGECDECGKTIPLSSIHPIRS